MLSKDCAECIECLCYVNKLLVRLFWPVFGSCGSKDGTVLLHFWPTGYYVLANPTPRAFNEGCCKSRYMCVLESDDLLANLNVLLMLNFAQSKVQCTSIVTQVGL